MGLAIESFLPSHYALAGILLYAGNINLLRAFRGSKKREHYVFGALCIGSALLSVTNALSFNTLDISGFHFYNKISISLVFILGGLIAVFFAILSNVVLFMVSIVIFAIMAVFAAANIFIDNNIIYSDVLNMRIAHLPWGENVLVPVVGRAKYAFVMVSSIIAAYGFSIYCAASSYLKTNIKFYLFSVLALLASLAFIAQGALSRFGMVEAPPMGAFGSFAMVLLTHFLLEQEEYQDMKTNGLIHENSVEALVVSDVGRRVTLVNRAFETITGLSRDEVLGHDLSTIREMAENREIYGEIEDALRSSGSWQGEIKNRRKDGSYFDAFTTVKKMYDDFGAPTGRITLFVDITDKKKADAEVWHRANYDALTGLANRELLADRLAIEMRDAKASGELVAVLHTDLDHFKVLNEAGQAFGDQALRAVGERMKSGLDGRGFVGRFAGDQFMVVMPGITDRGEFEASLDMFFKHISEPYHVGPREFVITQSVGVALFPSDADDAGALLDQAQLAMGLARKDGGNCYRFYAPEIQAEASERFLLTAELRGAVQKNQFELVYQPIIDLSSGVVLKAEALLRWRHPRHGLLGPARFIRLAEESGIIGELGAWVVAEAGRQLERWRARFPGLQISVNMSPAQFHQIAHKGGVMADVLAICSFHGNMCVEITEGTLADEHFGEVLQFIRGAGVDIAVDDFGTGYSSLSYLKKFNIQYLKIDRSFVQELDTSATDRSICEAIIVMSHRLGIKVIAEGIETQSQFDHLALHGCDFGQGYLFSRPVPEAQFERFMDDWISEQRYAELVGLNFISDLASMRA